MATFLLPRPPHLAAPAIELRRAPGESRSELNPDERRMVRIAARLQRVLSWMNRELQRGPVGLPRMNTRAPVEEAAVATRMLLGKDGSEMRHWSSASVAFRSWRSSLEQAGVFVLTLPMGIDGCRGFSLWEEYAPLIAVNTAWSAEARIFTLYHEYGHLVTRTNSACLEGAQRTRVQSDAVERWCEEFAAAVILPLEQLRQTVAARGVQAGVDDVSVVRTIAGEFKVSIRATALRFISLGLAGWELYRSLPPTADRKRPAGGGSGRDRAQIRTDQYGDRAVGLFAEALRRDVISRGDVLDYLDLPPQTLGAGAAAESASLESE